MRRLGCLWVFLLACGPSVGTPEGTNDGTEGGETTSTPSDAVTTDLPPPPPPPPPPPTTIGDSTEGTGESGSAETGCGFICPPDVEPSCVYVTLECDLWAQDCCPGEKCTAWANDGGHRWNASICRQVADDPDQTGDVCEVEGSGVSGLDTCDHAAMCWDVDPDTLQGVCVEFCSGSEDDPQCPSGSNCMIANDGALALCLPECDPFDDTCGDGNGCFPAVDAFVCLPAPTPNVGTGCAGIGGCDPGTVCVPTADIPGCAEGDGCCTPYCEVANPVCDIGLACVPFAWSDTVGACASPF